MEKRKLLIGIAIGASVLYLLTKQSSGTTEETKDDTTCTPDWHCRQPLDGYEHDNNNCEKIDRLNSICNPTSCTPNWQCRQPLDGYEHDNNNCGIADRLNSVCNPISITTKKIMPLGDSITALDNRSYRNKLHTLLTTNGYNKDFVGSASSLCGTGCTDTQHEGHSGYKIHDINNYLVSNRWIETYQPDIVLILLGTNDVNQNYLLDTAKDRLNLLINNIFIQKSNIKIFLSSIIPIVPHTGANGDITAEMVTTYNTKVQQTVNEQRATGRNTVYFVDMYNEAGINITTDLVDNLHPNLTGSNKIADVWYNHLITNW